MVKGENGVGQRQEWKGKSRRRGENARVQTTEGKRQKCRGKKLQEWSGIEACKNERERTTMEREKARMIGKMACKYSSNLLY